MNAYSAIANDGVAVTPSKVPFTPGSLYVGTGGNLVVETVTGTKITFNNVQDGTFIPVVCRKVFVSTTADNIVRLFTS